MLSLRIVATNYYQAAPIKGLDIEHSEFRDSPIKKIPVLQIFGSTPAGQKTCMHIHGAFPYLYVPYDGTQPEYSFLRQFALSLDRALNIANGSSHSKQQHVYKISIVSGIPIYGYHPEEEQFLKIYFYNPNSIKKAAELLLAGAVMNNPFQPHDSHISYPLQVFIDYNLYGMNFITVAALKFRKPVSVSSDKNLNLKNTSLLEARCSKQLSKSNVYKIWHEENIPDELCSPASVKRQSSCELEVDVVAADIVNKLDLNNPSSICVNQGLATLWENVKERTNVDIISQESNRGHDGVDIVLANSEIKHLERLHEILNQQLALRTSQSTPISSYSGESFSKEECASQMNISIERDNCPVVDAGLIKRMISCSRKFSKSQGIPSDSQDMSLTNILASLLDESAVLGPTQIVSLEEQDSIMNTTVLLTEQDELDDEAETQTMTNIVHTMMETESDADFPCMKYKLDDPQYAGVADDVDSEEDTDSDSEVDLLPQFDGASDKIPTSKQKGNSLKQRQNSFNTDTNTILSGGSETLSDVSNTSSTFRDGAEVSGPVVSGNNNAHTVFTDASETSPSGVPRTNNTMYSEGTDPTMSNSKIANTQGYQSGNKAWTQPGWSSPWSSEYNMEWSQSQTYQNWNQRPNLQAGYSHQRGVLPTAGTSNQTCSNNMYSPQHSYNQSSPQYQYPHYTSPSQEQQHQQNYQSPPHMSYQSQATSQQSQLYQSPTHSYNSSSHYLGSMPSKPYQSYQVPPVDQQPFRPYQLSSPSQSPRSDTFHSSNSQQSSYSSTEHVESYPQQQSWVGSHVPETNFQNCKLSAHLLGRADVSLKEDAVSQKVSHKSDYEAMFKKEATLMSSKCKVEQNSEPKIKMENTVFRNSDFPLETSPHPHLDTGKSNDSSSFTDSSNLHFKSENKHSFSTSSNINDVQPVTTDRTKFAVEKSTSTDMSTFNLNPPSTTVKSDTCGEARTNKVNVGINTSTPMMQQLLMEDSTTRMVIKKEIREAVKKPKRIPDPDKPKRKYVSKVKLGTKTNRPRSTSLSTCTGAGGFSPNPTVPSQLRTERAHSISFPFNNEPSYSGANNQNNRWLQHQQHQWHEQAYSQMYHQQQWDTNHWQNTRPSDTGFQDCSANNFQHKPYISEPSKSPYLHSQPLVSPDIDAVNTTQCNFTVGQGAVVNKTASGSYDKSSLSSLFQLVSDMNTPSDDNYMLTKKSLPSIYNIEKEVVKPTPASDMNFETSTKDFITLETSNKCNSISEPEIKTDVETNVIKPKVVMQTKPEHPCLGKQSRLKRLGLIQSSGNNEGHSHSPNLSYTYTFHVPTPVFKKLKFHFGDEARKRRINIVRMHPMDARRYSLLKIGREIVKISKLSEEDLAKHRVFLPAQTPLASPDGSTNRVNLNIPTVSVDKSSGDSASETNSLSKFDTDFPPNKVAPPSSFHASQLNTSRVRSNSSSSFRTSPGVSLNRSLSSNSDQRMSFTQEQNYNFFYPSNMNSTPYPVHNPMSSENVTSELLCHPRQECQISSSFEQKDSLQSQVPHLQGSSYASCQDYSQYYYQQQYCEQQPYFHQLQQSPSQQAQEYYNNSQTESKNELRSPVQHGTNRIDSGSVIGHSSATAETSTINNRVNAGISDSHAENLASNLAADSLNVNDQSFNSPQCRSVLRNSKYNCTKKRKGKKKRLFRRLTYCRPMKKDTNCGDLGCNNKPVLDTSPPQHSTTQSVSNLAETGETNTIFSLIRQRSSQCHKPRCTFQKSALKKLSKNSQFSQQQSKRILRNLRQRMSWPNNNNASKQMSAYPGKLKQLKRRGRKALREGVHYVIVGKFKGHQAMLVKINRVKVVPCQTVRASLYETLAAKDIVKRSSNVSSEDCTSVQSDLFSNNSPASSPLNIKPTDVDKEQKICHYNLACQSLLSPEFDPSGNDSDVSDNSRIGFLSNMTNRDFFCQFQECYLKHREAREVQHPFDLTSHQLFFKGVKHSFFSRFQMKLADNMRKHTHNYYSSSSDDEDDYLDAVVIKGKIRSSDYEEKYKINSTSTWHDNKEYFTIPSEGCPMSSVETCTSSQGVFNETTIHKHHAQINRLKIKCEDKECSLLPEPTAVKRESNDQQMFSNDGNVSDKDKCHKDDFLKRQMAFFEDISSDSDTGDTIIMYNHSDSVVNSSMSLSGNVSAISKSYDPPTLHIPLHQSIMFGCTQLPNTEVLEKKCLVSEPDAENTSHRLENMSTDLPRGEKTITFDKYQKKKPQKIRTTESKNRLAINVSLNNLDSLELATQQALTGSKIRIKCQATKPHQLYSRKYKYMGDNSKSLKADELGDIRVKGDDLKTRSTENKKQLSSLDDTTTLSPDTEDKGYSRNKCLRQKKRIKYVFYPEELSTSDSSDSCSEDYESSTKGRKSKKNKKGKQINNVQYSEIKRKMPGALTDDCKLVKNSSKLSSSRGRKKKSGDGKLLKSLSLLHMATLANLTEMQGDCLDIQTSNSETLQNERQGTSDSTLVQTSSNMEHFPSSSSQKKIKPPGNERTLPQDRLLHLNRSLKPGCNGASNIGSRPLPFNMLSSSPMPSITILNTPEQHTEQPEESSSVSSTLQLLETRKAQVNCASFSMKDILRLASEDSLDSDSKDSFPILRPPEPKRAQVKSTSLSINDIVMLTNVEPSLDEKEPHEGYSSTFVDNESSIQSHVSNSSHLENMRKTTAEFPSTSQLLSTSESINPVDIGLSTPLSLIDNVKCKVNSIFTQPDQKEQDLELSYIKSKLGTTKSDLTSMKENSFQEPIFMNTQSNVNSVSAKSGLTTKSSSLKERNDLCNVIESIKHPYNTSPEVFSNLERIETFQRLHDTPDVSGSTPPDSSFPLVPYNSSYNALIPRISITCDESAIRDNFNDVSSNSSIPCVKNEDKNLESRKRPSELKPMTHTVLEIPPVNCSSCVQKSSEHSPMNLSACNKCHNNYSPITPTSPMSPIDQPTSYSSLAEVMSPPYKKPKPLWYPWLTTNNNSVENSAGHSKTMETSSVIREGRDIVPEDGVEKQTSSSAVLQNQAASLHDNKDISFNRETVPHVINHNVENQPRNHIVPVISNGRFLTNMSIFQDTSAQNLPFDLTVGKRNTKEVSNFSFKEEKHIIHIPSNYSSKGVYLSTQDQIEDKHLITGKPKGEPLDASQNETIQGNTLPQRQSDSLSKTSFGFKQTGNNKEQEKLDSFIINESQKGKERTVSDKSTRCIKICPLKAPPTCQSVVNNLHDFGLLMVHSPKAFCSHHEDLADCPKERQGQVFKVESKRMSALPPFQTFHQLAGISEWQSKFLSVLSQSIRKSFKDKIHQSDMKSVLSGNGRVLLQPVTRPPRRCQAQQWLLKNARRQKQQAHCENVQRTCAEEQGQIKISETISTIEPCTPCHQEEGRSRAKKIAEKKHLCLQNSGCEDLQSLSTNTKTEHNVELTKTPRLNVSFLKHRRDSDSLILLQSQHHLLAANSSSSGEVSQIDGPTPVNTFNFKVNQVNVQDSKFVHKCQNVTVISLEVHVETRGDLKPDPEFDPVQAVFYSVQEDSIVDQQWNQTGIIIVDKANKEQIGLKKSPNESFSITDLIDSFSENSQKYTKLSDVDNVRVIYAEDETELIHLLLQLVKSFDPDILVGFEIQMLSWGYLAQRAAYLKIDLPSGLARAQEIKENKMKTEPDTNLCELRVTGRIVLNLWQILRHEVALNSYSFENAAYHILHRRIPLYSFHSLTVWYKNNSVHRWRVFEHYLKRVKGQLEIITQLDIIGKTSEFARIYGIEFYDVLSRGTQIRVESMMLRFARAQNYVCVSPSVNQRARQRAPECIPLTLEPESKYYTSPVVVLDFQSLYPSIMIAYNYCYSTCLGRLDYLEKIHDGSFEFGCSTLNVKLRTLKKIQDQVTISPNGVAFVKSSVRKGILPKMLEEILSTRLMVKKSMKGSKDDKDLFRMLNARQLGLKLIANVTYGYTGASFSGRMPCIEVGDSIVRKARESLERAIELVRNTPKWQARVVYGDTDSLFIHFPGCTKDEAFKLGNEIADTITQIFPSPMKLKFEKVYLPCVLQTKKRYFGYMYETPDQKEPTFEAKGIETVRRDSCSAVSKILERTIKVLFTTHDLSRVKSYVTRQLHKLLDGKVSIQDLIFAKEFRGLMGYKPAACVPSLEIARRRVKVDRRAEPRIGERVPYVIINGSPGLPLIQLVQEPLELINDATLRLNTNYYITKHILPPLDRIFALIGVNVFNWYQNMPKVIRLAPVSSTINTTKQGIISQFYTASNCPVCDVPTKKPICDNCSKDSQTVVFKLTTKMHQWDRTYQWLSQICYTCQGTQDKEQNCISLDCPILFRQNTAHQDLSRADYLREVLNKVLLF